MRKFRASKLAVPALVMMAALWGSTFVVTKDVVARIPSADLTFLRFGLALAVLVVLAPKALRMSRRTLVQGLVLGAVFTVGQLPQTYAMETVDASVAGFYTGLYMVLTPVLAMVMFRHRVRKFVWVAVALATAGLMVLTVDPSGGAGGFGWGQVILIVSALGFAAHIVLTGHMATPQNAMSLTLVQTSVLVIAAAGLSLPGGVVLPATTIDWVAIVYLAVLCGALSLFLQIWAQARVESTKAAVLMGTEPVWAAVFAVLVGGEVVSWQLVVGGLAIMGAIRLVIAPPGRRRGRRPAGPRTSIDAMPDRIDRVVVAVDDVVDVVAVDDVAVDEVTVDEGADEPTGTHLVTV